MAGVASEVRIIKAQQGDLDTVLEILDEASRWLSSKGLETQWLPSPSFRQTVRDNIDRGEVYLVKDVKKTVGTITLQWKDTKFWGDLALDAGYIHKLAITRSHAGQRLGHRLLRWAENKSSIRRQKVLAS